MAAITLSAAATALNSNAAAVGAAAGLTTANVQGIADLLSTLAKRPGDAQPPLMVSPTAFAQLTVG